MRTELLSIFLATGLTFLAGCESNLTENQTLAGSRAQTVGTLPPIIPLE